MTTPANLPLWTNVGPIPGVGAGFLNVALAVAVAGAIGGWLLIVLARRSRRRESPSCPTCGHDLRGHETMPDRCPECGAAVDAALVHGGRLAHLDGLRNAIRWTGRGLVATGLLLVVAILVVHPTRLRYTPTGWLIGVDLGWAGGLLAIDAREGRPARDIAGEVLREIRRRGEAGELTDAEVGRIARQFLHGDTGGWRLAAFEQDVVGVALLSGAVSPAEIGAARFMQHDVGSGRFNPTLMQPQLRLGGTGRIEISQPVCGSISDGMRLMGNMPADLFQIEIEVGSFLVDGQPSEGPMSHRVSWPVTGGSGRVFRVMPRDGTTFPEGPVTVEWDAEIKILGPETPAGSGKRPVLRSHVFPQRLPTKVDLVPPPPIVRSAAASEALAAALEAESVLEWDPKTGQGLLVLGTSTRSGLELGTPTVELLLESDGSSLRKPLPFGRDALERPRLLGEPGDGGAASALHATVGNVTWNGESAFKIGDTVRVAFDSTEFDPTTWWDRLDLVAFARGGYGRSVPGVDWRNMWREVAASLDEIVATRIEIDVPIVEWPGAETP